MLPDSIRLAIGEIPLVKTKLWRLVRPWPIAGPARNRHRPANKTEATWSEVFLHRNASDALFSHAKLISNDYTGAAKPERSGQRDCLFRTYVGQNSAV